MTGPALVTFATIVNDWVEPLVTAAHVPHAGAIRVRAGAAVLETNDRPVGQDILDSDTFVAVFGPELATVTV